MIVLRNKNYSSVWEVAKSLFTKDKPIDNSAKIRRLGEERHTSSIRTLDLHMGREH